jgi:probable HAF family extracellular repeat protein
LTQSGYLSEALAINESGTVVGYSMSDAGQFHAVTWAMDAGGAADLGTLSPGGESIASNISNSGVVAGSSTGLDGVMHAVVWSEAGLVDLGLSNDAAGAYGNAIAEAGWVVGSEIIVGRDRATLWRGGASCALERLGPTDAGWRLLYAVDVNAHGEIVGTGVLDGVRHAYVLKLDVP